MIVHLLLLAIIKTLTILGKPIEYANKKISILGEKMYEKTGDKPQYNKENIQEMMKRI